MVLRWAFACGGCFLAGILLGASIRSDPAPPAAVPGRAPPRAMVCAEQPLTPRAGRPPEEADLAQAWCLAQLQRLQVEQQATLNDWPDDREYAASELPDTWMATLEAAFEACDLPARTVVTDCSEPPCVAALKIDDLDAFLPAFEGCGAFHEAFPDPEVGLAPMAVRCPDGSVDLMVLLTTFDKAQRQAYFDDLGLTPLLQADHIDALSEGYRILGRRADALTRFWPCPGAN